MAAPRTEYKPDGSESSGSQPPGAAGPEVQSPPGEITVAIATLAIVTAVFVWWGWKDGAYFGNVFFPGAITLYGLLILLLLAAPFRARLSGPALTALGALVALAGWTLLSIAWSPTNDAAVQDFQRGLLFATVFALGLWSCNLAGRRMLLPLAMVAVTGAAVGIITTLTLANGTDIASYVHDDATLRFPIGYRNAEGAFFLICLWPMIALAAEDELPWQVRALIVGAATMVLELVVLSESRGTLPAAAVALVVFLLLSRRRLRAAAYLALAALPVLPVLPTLLDVFQHGEAGPGLLPLLRDSARAIAFTSLGSIALAAVAIRGVEFRLNLGRQTVQRISWAVAIAAVAMVTVGGTIFIAKRGGPEEFIDQRVSEFSKVGYPDLDRQGTRFGVNVGSQRGDFWRVALKQGGDSPFHGAGAGAFAAAYLRDGRSGESPKDPHSVEMLMFSELGVVGLLLFAAFVVGSAMAGLRSRRLGPSAAALVAGSLAAGAYWLVHSSFDWFWHYPALTAPAVFLLGAAAAPYLRDRSEGLTRRVRAPASVVLALVLLIAVPLFLSQRYSNRAHDEFPADPTAALEDLDRAASLDPYDPEPLLTKGVIASRLGREGEALSAFNDALDRAPEDYAAHYFLAKELAKNDLAAARAQAAEALRLSPRDFETRRLNQRLNAIKKG